MTLEEHFQIMMRGAFLGLPHPPVDFTMHMRRAFMSGAASFLAIATSLNADDHVAAEKGMAAISEELNRFSANVGTRAEPEDYE